MQLTQFSVEVKKPFTVKHRSDLNAQPRYPHERPTRVGKSAGKKAVTHRYLEPLTMNKSHLNFPDFSTTRYIQGDFSLPVVQNDSSVIARVEGGQESIEAIKETPTLRHKIELARMNDARSRLSFTSRELQDTQPKTSRSPIDRPRRASPKFSTLQVVFSGKNASQPYPKSIKAALVRQSTSYTSRRNAIATQPPQNLEQISLEANESQYQVEAPLMVRGVHQEPENTSTNLPARGSNLTSRVQSELPVTAPKRTLVEVFIKQVIMSYIGSVRESVLSSPLSIQSRKISLGSPTRKMSFGTQTGNLYSAALSRKLSVAPQDLSSASPLLISPSRAKSSAARTRRGSFYDLVGTKLKRSASALRYEDVLDTTDTKATPSEMKQQQSRTSQREAPQEHDDEAVDGEVDVQNRHLNVINLIQAEGDPLDVEVEENDSRIELLRSRNESFSYSSLSSELEEFRSAQIAKLSLIASPQALNQILGDTPEPLDDPKKHSSKSKTTGLQSEYLAEVNHSNPEPNRNVPELPEVIQASEPDVARQTGATQEASLRRSSLKLMLARIGPIAGRRMTLMPKSGLMPKFGLMKRNSLEQSSRAPQAGEESLQGPNIPASNQKEQIGSRRSSTKPRIKSRSKTTWTKSPKKLRHFKKPSPEESEDDHLPPMLVEEVKQKFIDTSSNSTLKFITNFSRSLLKMVSLRVIRQDPSALRLRHLDKAPEATDRHNRPRPNSKAKFIEDRRKRLLPRQDQTTGGISDRKLKSREEFSQPISSGLPDTYADTVGQLPSKNRIAQSTGAKKLSFNPSQQNFIKSESTDELLSRLAKPKQAQRNDDYDSFSSDDDSYIDETDEVTDSRPSTDSQTTHNFGKRGSTIKQWNDIYSSSLAYEMKQLSFMSHIANHILGDTEKPSDRYAKHEADPTNPINEAEEPESAQPDEDEIDAAEQKEILNILAALQKGPDVKSQLTVWFNEKQRTSKQLAFSHAVSYKFTERDQVEDEESPSFTELDFLNEADEVQALKTVTQRSDFYEARTNASRRNIQNVDLKLNIVNCDHVTPMDQRTFRKETLDRRKLKMKRLYQVTHDGRPITTMKPRPKKTFSNLDVPATKMLRSKSTGRCKAPKEDVVLSGGACRIESETERQERIYCRVKGQSNLQALESSRTMSSRDLSSGLRRLDKIMIAKW